MDIAAQILACGLELEEDMKIVEWVKKSLFKTDLIVGLESLLEWAYMRDGFNYNESYDDPEEAAVMRFVPFMTWPNRVNQEQFEEDYKQNIRNEWNP